MRCGSFVVENGAVRPCLFEYEYRFTEYDYD